MKATLKLWTVLLCAGFILGGCDPVVPENLDTDNDNTPVEQPENPDDEKPDEENPDDGNPDEPTEKPLTDGSLFTVQLNDDIMATVGTGIWNAIVYGNGKYVAVGYSQIAYSTNGTDWTVQEVEGNWQNVVYANGIYVAVGLVSHIAYSTDGINWTKVSVGVAVAWNDIIYAKDKFLAVGSRSGSYGCIAYSTDGIDWEYDAVLENLGFEAVAYGNGTFVAGGSNGLAYSTDGINWTLPGIEGTVYDVIYANGKFVVTGYGKIVYSPDGVNWSSKTVEDSTSWNAIAYGNDKFVTIGYRRNRGGYIAYSVDGINWTSKLVTTRSLNAVLYEEGAFVVVGNYGEIRSSNDGIKWNTFSSGTTEDLNCICAMQ